MKFFNKSRLSSIYLITATGFAVFAMFFGSGNLVFPLKLGKMVGENYGAAAAGLFITGICIPFLGLLGVTLYKGSTRDFFGTLGPRAPMLFSLLLLGLLGPFGVIPRCVTVAHGGMELLIDNLSLPIFAAGFCAITYWGILNNHRMIDFIGGLLTPFLLGALVLIIAAGLMAHDHPPMVSTSTPLQSFELGLTQGYQTMDLLAAFFFATTILHHMQQRLAATTTCQLTPKRFSLMAKTVGIGLLAAIYGAMVYLGACYGPLLPADAPEQSLGIIAQLTLGPIASSIICIAVVLACLTTAVALCGIIAKFIHDSFPRTQGHKALVAFTIMVITFTFSLLEFNGIAMILGPILEVLYPGLILLTVLNIASHYLKWSAIKLPTYLVFFIAGSWRIVTLLMTKL